MDGLTLALAIGLAIVLLLAVLQYLRLGELGSRLAATNAAERSVREELARSRQEQAAQSQALRAEVITYLGSLGDSLNGRVEGLRGVLEQRLDRLQMDNERKLEQMRQTVDEKLQGTLEARLGESFKQVSDRLEQVYRGLGEMRMLASGVGDLKKLLSSVKTRGIWGEVQLGALLEQVLTPDQYARNVAPTASGEVVEFAIKLPGREPEGPPVWLPVDSKFPLEAYQRLVDATDRGDSSGVDWASRELDATVKQCARDINRKYIGPPATTDFALLFLPTEGLYAEALRRPALAEMIQREYRVVLAGPSTLTALLNSLQMGFRTMAIQQRSSEVWELLAGVKTEFGKYAEVLLKVRKKLSEAQSTIDHAETRTRAIQRKLRSVEGGDESPLLEETFE